MISAILEKHFKKWHDVTAQVNVLNIRVSTHRRAV